MVSRHFGEDVLNVVYAAVGKAASFIVLLLLFRIP